MSLDPQSSLKPKDSHSSTPQGVDTSTQPYVPDLHANLFAVGGGDLYIAELVREARMQGGDIRSDGSEQKRDELSNSRPPGYES